jgi:vacuolar protein sorting-associated protein 72
VCSSFPRLTTDRRPVICPFTGVQAKYRHPQTNTPYATVEGYKQIQALLQHRYVWDEDSSVWYGGEEDLWADGVGNVEGWAQAVHGGWMGGKEIEQPEEAVEEESMEVENQPEAEEEAEAEVEEEAAPAKSKGKKRKAAEGVEAPAAKKAKGKTKAGKGKGKARA